MVSLSPIQRFTVNEDSMLPSLKPGDDVLIFKLQKGKPGDIVVARHENIFITKRIKEIKGSEYFLVGDNSKNSTDSRHFGPIKKSKILGKIIYTSKS